jgi:ferric-dicitrate binding protein FerR (iron transport regulator)
MKKKDWILVRCSRKARWGIVLVGLMVLGAIPALAGVDAPKLGQALGVVLKRLEPVTAVNPALTRAVLADYSLYPGDDLRTVRDGMVQFRLNDYSDVTLSGDGQLQINRATTGRRYSLKLLSGAVLVDTTMPAVDNHDYLVVKTDFGTVRAKKGKFWIGPLDEALAVINLEGDIDVITYGGARRLVEPDQMIKLRDSSLPPPEPVILRDRIKEKIMADVTFPARWTGEK